MLRCTLALLGFAILTTVNAAERIELVAGSEQNVVNPFGIDFAADGAVYFVEFVGGERLKMIDAKGAVTTLAGTGKKGNSGDGGPGKDATFNGMHGLAVGSKGLVYLADTFNNRIRTFDPKTGRVEAFAGTGEKGFSGDDGPARDAKFGGPHSIAFDRKHETMYVADLDNRRIRAIDMKSGKVRTVAGNGKKGVPSEGLMATEEPLVDPRAVAAGAHDVYVLERGGHALRQIEAHAGRIFTMAGTGKAGSALGDGTAQKAMMNGPKHLCVDPRDESIVIADTENHRILRYTAAKGGRLEVIAGTGKKGKSLGDGDPRKCELIQPHGVAIHPKTGELYIADSGNDRILKVAR